MPLPRTVMNLNALYSFQAIVGPDHVITEGPLTSSRVLAVVRPNRTTAVAACVRTAQADGLPLYPVSRGPDDGSKWPTGSPGVVLDLGLMNQIIALDEQMGVLTVQPGVTFKQASAYLREKGSRFTLVGIGAAADASLVGSAIEQDLGLEHVSDLEVVLATGEILHTGLGRYTNARAKYLSRTGAGPLLDHLLVRHHLGIVTQMSIWLAPAPSHFQSFVYVLRRPEQLGPVIDALRELRLKEVIRSTATLSNDFDLLGLFGIYPWQAYAGSTAFMRRLARAALRRRIPWDALWVGDGALFSHCRAQARVERAMVRRALGRHVSRLMFFDRRRVSFLALVERVLSSFSARRRPTPFDVCSRLSPYVGQLLPHHTQRDTADLDAHRDRCESYRLAPVLPFRSEDVGRALALAEKTAHELGYEPAVSIQMSNARTIEMMATITYDRASEGEEDRARACHDAIFRELITSGYYPSRPPTEAQRLLPDSDDAFTSAVVRIKAALDPRGVLLPDSAGAAQTAPARAPE
ncbi:MAG: FAD-dependent oxidoreductase [Polyangiaceae bacterium]|nr:FAD-dependent oxidoreductase [Polyangiaceae bacterium]